MPDMTVSHSFCQRTEREISPLHFFPRWQRSLRTKNRKIIKIIFSVSLKSSVSVCLSPSVTIQVPKLPPVPSVPQNRVPESTTVLLSRVLKGIYVNAHTYKEAISISQGGIVKRLCRSAFSLPSNRLLVLVLFQFPDKVPDNFNLLSAVSAGFVRRVDNDFLYKLIDDSRR